MNANIESIAWKIYTLFGSKDFRIVDLVKLPDDFVPIFLWNNQFEGLLDLNPDGSVRLKPELVNRLINQHQA